MRPYGIGLDIGITSVGWAAVALDHQDAPCGILDMGVRIFDAAENPKDGSSLAAPRREKRSQRRRIRRHRHRNERIRQLFLRERLLSQAEMDTLFDGKLEDIYSLRTRGLDELLSKQELARVLLHISQRRGFRSNRKNVSTQEDGKLLEAVSDNVKRMRDGGYRTVGEMLFRDAAFEAHKRNKGGEYLTTVSRSMIESEIRTLFSSQRRLGSACATEALEQHYLDILLSQRSFDEGPGGDSPYGGAQIERMIGKCTFYPDEPRAARASYSFEYFSLLQKVNHIRLQKDGESVPLTEAQRKVLIELAHKTENLDFARVRKALQIPDAYRFSAVAYRIETDPAAAEKKEKFNHLRAYHTMRKAIDGAAKGRFALLSTEQRDAIGTVLTLYKSQERISEKLAEAGIESCDIAALESVSGFSKTGHISLRACRALIPHLEQGMNYSEACAAAGLEFRGHEGDTRTEFLHPSPDDLEEITSPVVRRAVAQTVKVLNAIIRRYGSPVFVNVELAREMAKDFNERRKAEKENKENRAKNERIMQRIREEFGKTNPTGLDLVKLKLYEEQAGVCPYSQKQMSIARLFEPNYAEVDHIIPYSISFDDSYRNKVLVLAEENRNKGNRLPLQYLTGERRDNYIVWVNSSVRDYRKKQKLLKPAITDEDRSRFKERNLQDTKTMSRFLMNYINDHLQFGATAKNRKKRVTAVNGIVTSYLRKRWGITKIRGDGDLHHAVDALVVACATDGMIQQITRYAQYRECRYMQTETGSVAVDEATGEMLRVFPYPWEHFRKELEARLSSDPAKIVQELKLPFYYDSGLPLPKPIFVSRMPRRKVSGAAHKDTVKSPKALRDGKLIVKRPLTELKLKNGEIENYYDPGSDRLLYEALKARLAAFGGNAAKAFAEPFYKPKRDGTQGPLVKKVKLAETTTLNVPVYSGNGAADNGSMVRIDVFRVENDGYYFVPVYVADTLKPELPNRACVAFKPYAEWKPMRDEDFLFSLYPNDLIRVTHKTVLKLSRVSKDSTLPASYETRSELLYYISAGISGAVISCRNHDNTYEIKSMGIKTLPTLEKYTVDVLGEYHKVEKEPRLPFTGKRS